MIEAEPNSWGISHTVALALVALDLDIVHRSTLRALLPEGRVRYLRTSASYLRHVERGHGASVNVITKKFQRALWILEQMGGVVRGSEFVLVRDRRTLLDWATSAEPKEWIRFATQAAVDQINEDIRLAVAMSPKALERRRQELIAIQRLMEEGFGSANWSGRHSVRFTPRSKTI